MPLIDDVARTWDEVAQVKGCGHAAYQDQERAARNLLGPKPRLDAKGAEFVSTSLPPLQSV